MACSISHCAPYLSITMYRVEENKSVSVQDIRRAVRRKLREPSSKQKRTFRWLGVDVDTDPDVALSALRYLEERKPAWYQGSELHDQHNHIVAILKRGQVVGLTFSSPTARNLIFRSIQESKHTEFKYLQAFAPQDMEVAFVENQIRTLWLNSTHGQTVIKPDSKILSGLELESALDPLEDQAYYFSSIRSTCRNQALSSSGTDDAIVGVRPTRAQVWIGPTASWDNFLRRSVEVLGHAEQRLAQRRAVSSTIPVLAKATPGLVGVEGAYGVALIVPETIGTDIPHVDDEERWLEQFRDSVQFKDIIQIDGGPNFAAEVFWNEQHLGKLQYLFKNVGNAVKLTVKGKFDGDDDYLDVLRRVCSDPDNLTIYYGSGHTFARGRMFLTNFRDAQFTDWRWVNMRFDGTEVHKEKPYNGRRFVVDNIGRDGDKSLFGLVARHWPNLQKCGRQTGWLVCDDGAMESADFIHLNDAPEVAELTLIHVKGSGSNDQERGISVSDYEVVIGQAVKNLRHVDRLMLKNKLERNGDGALRGAVWHDGERQENREGVIQVLEAIGSRLRRKVVILQPRVTKTEYNRVREMIAENRGPIGKRHRLKQLDALLLSARANCFGLGAGF